MRAFAPLLVLVLLAPTIGPPAPPVADPFDAIVRHDLRFAASRLEAALGTVLPGRYPAMTTSSGAWSTTDPAAWTSGFYPGALWRIYEATGCRPWATRAAGRDAGLEGQELDASSHDLGFKIFTSIGNAARLTGSAKDRDTVLAAAASLATRYSPVVTAIRSWDGPTPAHFRVIIDNVMNLELLFWASSHGGPRSWYRMAVDHALRTMHDHVRADGSTYQGVDYDPATGRILGTFTTQGAATESTWARGQAWGLHGFTMVYRETGDARFLETARHIADFYLDHLPADHVPLWDLEAPGIPNTPRDSSAAAVAAAGLLELATLETDGARADRYAQAARDTITSLSSPAYLAEGTTSRSILLHGTKNAPVGETDRGLIYGDYYFVEALLRYRSLTGRITDTSTGHPVVGARVTLADDVRSLSRLDGRYLVAGVPAGDVTVRVSAPGYEDAVRTVAMGAVGPVSLDVALVPSATGSGPAITRCRIAGRGS